MYTEPFCFIFLILTKYFTDVNMRFCILPQGKLIHRKMLRTSSLTQQILPLTPLIFLMT